MKDFNAYIQSIHKNNSKVFGLLVYSLDHVRGVSSRRAFLEEFLANPTDWPPLFLKTLHDHIISFKTTTGVGSSILSAFDVKFFNDVERVMELEALQYVHESFLEDDTIALTKKYQHELERFTLLGTVSSLNINDTPIKSPAAL